MMLISPVYLRYFSIISLRKNVYSDPLPIFKSDYLGFVFVFFFAIELYEFLDINVGDSK